jgi:hypothetical protein
MSTQLRTETAKIYQFPRRTELGPDGRRREDRTATALDARGVLGVECGSGWYHQAAIDEANRPRKI